MNTKIRRIAAVMALPVAAAAAVLAVASPANANSIKAVGVSPDGLSCDESTTVQTTNVASNYMIPLSSQIYKDGKGGIISVSVTTAGTVSSTATVSAGVTVNDVVASAKIDVSASVTNSTSITVGHTYTHNITAGKYGNAEYGSWGYNINWQKIHLWSSCAEDVLANGTGKVTSNLVGWKYWETSV